MNSKVSTALPVIGGIIVGAVVVFFMIDMLLGWQFVRFQKEMDVSVPTAENSESSEAADPKYTVLVDNRGNIRLNDEEISHEDLIARLHQIAEAHPDEGVIIRGDASADFQHVMKVLDEIKEAGIWNVSFATMKSSIDD